MEFKTCEEYVLAMLQTAEKNNDFLREELNKTVEMYNNSQKEKTELEAAMQMKINQLDRTLKAFLHKTKLKKEGYIEMETIYSFEHDEESELIREAIDNYKSEIKENEDTEDDENNEEAE